MPCAYHVFDDRARAAPAPLSVARVMLTVAIVAVSAVIPNAATNALAQDTAPQPSPELSGPPPAECARKDFETVVEQSAQSLRDLNFRNKPAYQEKLRALKAKRQWAHEQFMREAEPLVRDATTAVFDNTSDELLRTISRLGEEGAHAKQPDCAMLLELRARMTLLVETQKAKWSYLFEKIDTELWR